MKSPDGNTISSWREGVDLPTFPALTADLDTDVCVVGAGIAGLTVAYQLAKENLRVVLIDAGPIGDGQTGRTSAHLASALDDRFFEVEKAFGVEGSKLAYQSHARAIDLIETIASNEAIACDFKRVDGILILGEGDDPKLIEQEFQAAQRAGFAGVEKLDRAPLDQFDSGACIRFPGQAQFHPLKYLAGLARAAQKLGVQIYCGNRITDVQGTDEKKHERATATTKQGQKIRANAIVVATNTPAPINDWFGIYTKQSAYRSFVVGLPVPKGSVKEALYWDTLDPYHYVRNQPRGEVDILLVGGEDHKTGQAPEGGAPFLRLEQWARKRFPVGGDALFRWSGQVQEPVDYLGYIGRAPTAKPDVYVVTGDSGMGLTHGTIAGLLIPDLIQKRDNPWEKIYDPSRKPIKSAKTIEEFAVENTNTVSRYVDYITPGEIKSADDLRPGQGAVVREGLQKVAIYRDESGSVHRCSPVCTHLACVVAWNSVESTWDCPCHGARYDPLGRVIMGPAIDDLKPLQARRDSL
jgi:glycine/D-amino acid oxidase-like deaminating enzyme/nitrite reductase/ring-hydroxylating ferredoxin subunit